jgi:putative addiction module component (TIGR02574 family)
MELNTGDIRSRRTDLRKLKWHMDERKATSIFDLSPSEKLQLVEDLWDDLAATPEDVPVHDWQKHELARRRANLQRNPGSALPWLDVKRRVRERGAR